jgi:hypothetical protein
VGIRKEVWCVREDLACIAPFDRISRAQFNFPGEIAQPRLASSSRPLQPSTFFRTDYLTHLFTEMDVFLQPDWMSRRVSISVSLKHLKLFRPGAIDLVLTKMMRGADPEDLADIEFIMKLEPLSQAQLSAAFQCARVPDIPELHDAFLAAQPKVLALVNTR